MESKKAETANPKISSEEFIRLVNGCLNEYYKHPRSRLGSLYHPMVCSQQSKDKKDIEEYSRSMSFVRIFEDLVNANHWHQGVYFLLNYVEFYIPPVQTIQKLLDTILVINEENLVFEAQLYLHQLMIFHPPNTDDMSNYYWEILKEEESEQKRVSSPRDPCGSFVNVLHQFEAELSKLDQKKSNCSSIASGVSYGDSKEEVNQPSECDENDDACRPGPSEEPLEIFDVAFLTGGHMKSWWKNASCLDRIHRLLFIFSVMIELFELDLDLWRGRSHKAQHPLARPIISRLIWPYEESGNPSSIIVKMIINMYAVCHRNGLYDCMYQIEKLVDFVAIVLPASPQDQGEGYPPDSYQRRVFAQHVADALVGKLASSNPLDSENENTNFGADRLDIALARLNPDWLRLIVSSKIHSQHSKQSCADLPLNVAQLAQMILQGVAWGDSTDSNDESSSDSDEAGPSTSSKRSKKKEIKRSATGETQLHVLARTGKSKKLSELLTKEGSNINVTDYAGWTAVHEAVNHGRLECVRVLCEYKPNTEIHSMKFRRSSGKTETDRNSDGSNKSTKTSLAVNLHIKGGDMGLTPLHEAVIQNRADITALLLDFGGSSLLKDTTNAGHTALDLAANETMINVLKKKRMESRRVEKKWISGIKSNEVHAHHLQVTRSCIMLRCMLLHCYLETNCLWQIMGELKTYLKKFRKRKRSYTKKNIDYLECCHDVRALKAFLNCVKSHMSGKITFPQACLLVFLC